MQVVSPFVVDPVMPGAHGFETSIPLVDDL